METTSNARPASAEADHYEDLLRQRGAGFWIAMARSKAIAFGAEIASRAGALRQTPATPAPQDEVEAAASCLQMKLTLTEDDRVILRDTLVIGAEPETRVHDVDVDGQPRRYVLSFAFAQPTATLMIEGPKYRRRVAVPVRRSAEVESIAVAKKATLWFKLAPLP